MVKNILIPEKLAYELDYYLCDMIEFNEITPEAVKVFEAYRRFMWDKKGRENECANYLAKRRCKHD